MTNSPDIEWLQRKWNLPATAVEAVLALMESEANGGTACEIPSPPSTWGNAVSDGTADTPLVLMRHAGRSYLQSRRLFTVEREIAARILALAERSFPRPDPAAHLAALFPGARAEDRQMNAARVAISHALTLVTGGPGTGKTHTLARILALLAADEIPAGRIRLAAPTGKAAERMKRAVTESLDALPPDVRIHQTDLARIAESSATIHSLLGYHPGRGRCRFHPGNPLGCSVLIVDECSMVDVELWRALLGALPADGRLILLGDPNQLESVGQGNVFAELARFAAAPDSPLHHCHVHLTEARRFRERPGILALAQALENSDADAAVALLEASTGPAPRAGVSWLDSADGTLPPADFPAPILAGLESVATAPCPEDALAALGAVCILTAQRRYFVGSAAMSAAIETHFARHPDIRNHPIIINRNDPETGLRNGTVGIVHITAEGRRKAFFPSPGGALREFSVARLPDFSPAWAITIHRSQGSEYDDVLVILPQEESAMATRALLYTAITRARKNVFVAGSLASVRKAVLTSSNRETLLAAHLARARETSA